jgi:hypothetical protein
MCYILFICESSDEYLGCVHFLVIVANVAVSMVVFFQSLLSVLLGVYPEIESVMMLCLRN